MQKTNKLYITFEYSLKHELEATKKNLNDELQKEQLVQKEIINEINCFKKRLTIARKEARLSKDSDVLKGTIDRQMLSIQDLVNSLSQPRETATFAQLSRFVVSLYY